MYDEVLITFLTLIEGNDYMAVALKIFLRVLINLLLSPMKQARFHEFSL